MMGASLIYTYDEDVDSPKVAQYRALDLKNLWKDAGFPSEDAYRGFWMKILRAAKSQ
jgi:hypothetical protein